MLSVGQKGVKDSAETVQIRRFFRRIVFNAKFYKNGNNSSKNKELSLLSEQVGYRHIKKLSIVKKRNLYTEAMRKVNIFESFEREEM